MPPARTGRTNVAAPAAAIAMVMMAIAPFAVQRYQRTASHTTLVVESSPAGQRVTVDGVERGVTPASVSINSGDHDVRVGTNAQQVSLKVTARPGETLRQNVIFDVSPAPPVVPAAPVVAAEPKTPPVIPAPRAAEGKGAGWLAVTAPVPVRVFEGTDLVGSSDAARIMLPTGQHTLELRNDEFGYQEKRVVQIMDAKTTTLTLPTTKSTVHINAIPWAEVSIDGLRIGETPIGNHALAIGMHDVVFRHPELGERRRSVAVRNGTVSRVSVDFTKKP